MARSPALWDISHMAVRPGKKSESEARARAIYQRLMQIDRPEGMSNNDWAKRAGVNTSFFTQLKGNDNKPPSEPSIGNLRLVLESVGSSIPEFFVDEARGRLVQAKSQQDVEQAFEDALREMPPKAADRPQYLAKVVGALLGLPASLPATSSLEGDSATGDQAAAAPPRRATKKK